MRAARGVLLVDALVFAAFGAWAVWDPVGMLAGVALAPTSGDGVIELRAFYGGLELGIALFLLACVPRRPAEGLWAAAALLGGLGGVRLAAVLLAGSTHPVHWASGAAELSGALVSAIAAARARL